MVEKVAAWIIPVSTDSIDVNIHIKTDEHKLVIVVWHMKVVVMVRRCVARLN